MKKLMISMLAMAAMVSCTNEIEGPDQPQVNQNEPVEIKLNAGVGTITTKAPVNDLATPLNILFWRPADATEAAWGTGSSLFAKTAAASGVITFYTDAARTTEAKQYYNADATKKSWLAGCYLGTATDPTMQNGVVEFTIDGQNDVMATDGASGIKTDGNGFSDFTFNHQLSKLKFTVAIKAGDDATKIKEVFGKVTEVAISEQNTDLKLTLAATPSLELSATPKIGQFTITPSLDITAAAELGNVLLYPDNALGKTGKPIKLVVKTENNTTGINVDVIIGDGSTGLAKNTLYNVTLTFSSSTISATAVLGTWSEGTGAGEVK